MTSVDFGNLKTEMEAMFAEMETRARDLFKKGTDAIFESNPELVSFSWTQYTPYWNDGEPCYFSVHDYLTVDFSDGTLFEDWTDYSRKYEEGTGAPERHMDTADMAHSLVASIPAELMERVFGDHVKVEVYRDRVEVEEYEHE